MEQLLPIVLVLGIFALIAIYAHVQEKRRREAWMALAESLGLAYRPGNDGLRARCSGFKLFGVGRSQRVVHELHGTSGSIEVSLADYEYTTGSGKNRTTHRWTVCVLDRQGLFLPASLARPERRLLDAIGQVFGGQDIDFAGDPEFSKAYVLQGLEEGEVRKLYDDATRRWFAARAGLGLRVETNGSIILIAAERLEVDKARVLFDHGLDLMMMWAERDAGAVTG